MKRKKPTFQECLTFFIALCGLILYFASLFGGDGVLSPGAIYGVILLLLAWLINLEDRVKQKEKNENIRINK